MTSKKRTRTTIYLIAGILLTLLAITQLVRAASNLRITRLRHTSPPVTFITPKGEPSDDRPLVIIGNGYAGSSQIMYGFAYTFAHSGYNVMLLDFSGHGANPKPFPANWITSGNPLLQDAIMALDIARQQGYVNDAGWSILGHSMGTRIALAFGQSIPETRAVIAVSPVRAEVSPDSPKNLLLMAGALESPFIRNAEQVLERAGGESDDFLGTTARKMVIIPGVEHVSILFSPTAHHAALAWLNQVFGTQQNPSDYTDRRILWYAIAMIGILLSARTILELTQQTLAVPIHSKRGWYAYPLTLFTATTGASILTYLLELSGLSTSNLLGLQTGGYLLTWFLFAGLIGMLIWRVPPNRPQLGGIRYGLAGFISLWLGVGLLAHYVWIPWLLIPQRLGLWLLGALFLFPWNYLIGNMTAGKSKAKQWGLWLTTSIAILWGIFFASRVGSGASFLMLIIPLFPVFLGIHQWFVAPFKRTWSFALSASLWLSWVIAAIFPIL